MPDKSKGTVLFAEDDPVLREVYIKKFTLAGYTVVTAPNGKETIDILKKSPPNALILDINMPEVNGFEVLKQFPKNKRKFPIILLTNLADDNTRSQGEELGADDFFIKSQMTIKTLIDMVEELLAK